MDHHAFAADRRTVVTGALALAAGGLAARPAAAAPVLAGSYGKVNPQFKYSEFVKRRDGMTEAAFRRQWLGAYGPRLAREPGLKGLVLNTVNHTRSPEVAFDGVVSTYFDDDADHAAAWQERLAAERGQLIQPWTLRMATREIVIRTPAPGAPWPKFKRIGLLKKRGDLTDDQFLLSWRDDHGPQADALFGLRRYTLDIIDRRLTPTATWDGFATLWWDDAASFAKSMELSSQRRATGDRAIQTSTLMFVDETILV